MSLSLSALIYGSQSEDQISLDADLDLDLSLSQSQSQSQYSQSITPIKQDDNDEHVERYYQGMTNSSYSGSVSNQETERPGSNRNTPPPSTTSTPIKVQYDYEQNTQDREFFGTLSSRPKKETHQKYIYTKKKKVLDAVSGRWMKVDDETEEEREDRLRKVAEKTKRYLRLRRNPRWNFRKEVDVGHTIQAVLREAMEKDQEEHRKQEEDNDSDDGDHDEDNHGVTNTPLGAGLDSLITRAKELEKPATIYVDPKEDPSHPLHYLWLGHMKPKCGYSYLTLLGEMKPKNTPGWKDTRSDNSKVLNILIDRVVKNQSGSNGEVFLFKKYHDVDHLAPLLEFGDKRVKDPHHFKFMRKDYLKKCPERPSYDRELEEKNRVQAMFARFIANDFCETTTRAFMEKLLNLLHETSAIADQCRNIIRQSQGLACNYVLWNSIHPIMLELKSKNFLTDEDYDAIRRELLTADDSEFFSDPWMIEDSRLVVSIGIQRRKLIYNFIEKLRKKHLNSNSSMGSKKRKIEEISNVDEGHTSDDSSSERKIKMKHTKTIPPWQLRYIASNAKVVSLDAMQHTDMSEKYSQVIHNSTTSISTIYLTVSFLTSLMLRQRSMQKWNTIDKSWKIHKEIEDFLSRLSATCWSTTSEKPTNYETVLMSAPLAFVTLIRQSTIANNGMVGTVKKMKQEHEVSSTSFSDSSEDDATAGLDQSANAAKVDFKEVASELAASGQLYLRDEKLKIFHQIHLTTGVSIIAKCFQSSCASILSRPCFTSSLNSDTPFDLLRQALENTESQHGYQRNSMAISYGSNVTDVDELIRELEVSADVFFDILNFAPDNFLARCWYVAARIGSVVVASGIDIGKNAQGACPHEYSVEEFENGSGRSRHSKYNILRASASTALRQLLELQNSSKTIGPKYHWALKSLLEWKQAVFLLAMRPHINSHKVETIRQLHAYHTIRWAEYDCSYSGLLAVAALQPTGLVSQNSIMSVLTKIIQKDPNTFRPWLALASVLIPIKGEIRLARQRQKSNWWAADIQHHWKRMYFSFPMHLKLQMSYELHHVELKELRKILVKEMRKSKTDGDFEKHRCFYSKLKRNINLDMKDDDWMWPDTPSDLDEEDHFDLQDDDGEMRDYDDELPSSIKSNILPSSEFLLGLEGSVALFVSKSIIAHHIYNSNEYSKDALCYLILKTLQTDRPSIIDKSRIEYKVLLWLVRMNMGVIGYVDVLISELVETKEHNKTHLLDRTNYLESEFSFARL